MKDLGIVPYSVTHQRLRPKRYKFTHRFFWFKVCLDNLRPATNILVGLEKFGIYTFYNKDHLKLNLGKQTARQNYIEFAQRQGLKQEVKSVSIYTSLRFFGYVFNPVSFVLLTDVEDRQHAIIEIGNTFNEQKPYFVHNDHFTDDGFKYVTKKYFYISPFIAHDNTMTFRLKRLENKIFIHIQDEGNEGVDLQVSFSGEEKVATSFEIIKQTLIVPFVTLKTIILIHYHAMILWFMGIKYFKKDEEKHLQRGTYLWKL